MPKPPDFRTIGATIYGPTHWMIPMSEALGVGLRSVQRWASSNTVPVSIWPEIAAVARRRAVEVERVAEKLEARQTSAAR